MISKDLMEVKLFHRCTQLLYRSVLSLDGNVNTRRMSKPDMGSIFHFKKSIKYSGHRKLLCELSKFNALILLGFRLERTGFNMYGEYTQLHLQLTFLAL